MLAPGAYVIDKNFIADLVLQDWNGQQESMGLGEVTKVGARSRVEGVMGIQVREPSLDA